MTPRGGACLYNPETEHPMRRDPVEGQPSSNDGLLRFNLAMQRSRAFVYLFALGFGTMAIRVGVLEGSLLLGYAVIGVGVASAILLYMAYRAGLDRRLGWNIFWLGMLVDVAAVTMGVYYTGGVRSPWYLFYLAISASAAFAAGAVAAWVISSLNAAAYLGLLLGTGLVRPLDTDFYYALYQIGFLYFCSAFFLMGIGNLREKRLEVRRLREEDRAKVHELTRLTEELDMKSKELVEANQKIREADRLKSQFLASMSHELRTPMNAIIGFSEILAERLEGQIEPKHHGFIRHILSSGKHLLGIINDVLDLSKIEAGRMEVFPERFQVGQVVSEVVNVMRGNAARSGLEIAIDVPSQLPPIETDLPKFRQILFNLLSNAVKFSPEGGAVTLRARLESDAGTDDAEIAISVIDQGPGIPKEHREAIFQEFRQLESPARPDIAGTGLGLALVKRFCELLGGSVAVDSELGAGSTFTFRLPLSYSGPEPVTGTAGDTARHGDSALPRVLVVEDDDVAWESLSRHLASGSYLPIRARHGDEALRFARQFRPVAITLDLVLPGLDGWDVLKRLKADEATADIPVVVVSMLDNRELGLALGAHDYFVKPVDRKRLVQRIRQVTGQASSRAPKRLLVIDDDPAFRDLLAEELARFDYTVLLAESGEKGIAMARADAPDVIVLDLVLPGTTGFEVAEELRKTENTAHIPILVMTSMDLSREDRARLQSKIAAIVPKGRSPATRLLTAIHQLER
jgi:signal transduction histidine kinase/CheY-like chemotaxis protein